MKVEKVRAGYVLIGDDGKPIGTYPDEQSAERQKTLLEYQARRSEQKPSSKDDAYQRDQDNAGSIHDLAQAAYDKGDYVQASALFQQANKIFPNKASADMAFKAAQADEAARTGKAPQARPVTVVQEQRQAPMDPHVLFELGRDAYKRGDYQAATDAFSKANEASPHPVTQQWIERAAAAGKPKEPAATGTEGRK